MKKTLLFLGAPFSKYKGGSEYQYEVLEGVLKERFDVYYLFRHVEKSSNPRHMTYNYRIRSKYSRYNYTDAFQIYRLLRDLSPDVIYKRGGNYISSVAALYAKRNNKRFIWHIALQNDVEPYRFRWDKNCAREYIDKSILQYAINHAAVVVGQAHYQDDLLQRQFKRSCGFILPNVHPVPPSRLRKQEDLIHVLWIANFKPWKRPEIFVELAETLKDEPCKFIMVGRPPVRTWKGLDGKIRKMTNLEEVGELEGDQVNTLLGSSHMLINTSEYEGFPNTFIQAWMRRVVPVSLCVDPDGVLSVQRAGVLSGSFGKLVEDVKALVRDRGLREETAERGYEYAIKKHAVENNIHRIWEIFSE